MDPRAAAIALTLAALALAGCAGADETRLTVDYAGRAGNVDATVALDEEDLASRPYFEREGKAHPGFPSAFDQLVAWSERSDTPIDVQHASFGFFLCGIDGQPGHGAKAYWSLKVNGTPSPVGMQEARLWPGSEVTWRLEPSDFPNCPDAPAQGGNGTAGGAPTGSAGPLRLDAPARVEAAGGKATVRGTVTPGALVAYRAGAATGQATVDGEGAWSFTLSAAPGRTEVEVTADDGAATASARVLVVRLATARVQAEFNGFPGHADRDDAVTFDPSARASASSYAGRDLAHPGGATAHDLMVEWANATGVKVTYAYSNGLGYSVASIDGVGAPVEHGLLSSTWCYSVNGRSADKGISTMPVAEGDTVTWSLGCA